MRKTRFILHEKFRTETIEQRKEGFRKKLERYLIDALKNGARP